MKKVLLAIAVFSLFSFGIPNETIQRAKQDFAALNKAFSSEKMSVEMIYNFYEYHDSNSPIETKKGVYYKKGNSQYSKIMNTEMLRNDNMTITAQTEDKLLVVSGPMSKTPLISVGPDTLLRICKSIQSFKLPNNQIKYELVFPDNTEVEFKKLELVYESGSYKLNKFVMYFKKQDKVNEDGSLQPITPKVEVLYKNYNKTNVDVLPVFNESNYVTKVSKNKYKCSGKYQDYEIYNQKIN